MTRLFAILLILSASAAQAATYSAIVIDDPTNGAGGDGDYAVGQADTLAEAHRIAMSNCTLGGNKACRPVVATTRCAAVTASGDGLFSGRGISKGAATVAAMQACHGAFCHLLVADCVGEPLSPPG